MTRRNLSAADALDVLHQAALCGDRQTCYIADEVIRKLSPSPSSIAAISRTRRNTCSASPAMAYQRIQLVQFIGGAVLASGKVLQI